MKDEVSAKITTHIHEMLVGARLITQDKLASLKSDMAATLFAVAKNSESPALETGFLATMRIALRGSRQVITVPLEAWREHIASTAMVPGNVMPAALTAGLQNCSLETMKAFMQKFPDTVKFASMTPGYALYVPPGTVALERVGSSDLVGVRCQILEETHQKLLESLNAWLISVNKSNARLQLAVDLMNVLDTE